MFRKIKDFYNDVKSYLKLKRVEKDLLVETKKIMEAAANIDGLKEWIGKKYWYIRPNGVVEQSEIKKVFITIEEDGVDIKAVGARGDYYNELAFMDEVSARDMGSLVAGTYIKTLEEERDYLQKELELVYTAMLNANVPEQHDYSEMNVEPEIDMSYIDTLIANKVKVKDYPEDKKDLIKKLVKQRKEELKKEAEKKKLKKSKSKTKKEDLLYDVTKGNNGK